MHRNSERTHDSTDETWTTPNNPHDKPDAQSPTLAHTVDSVQCAQVRWARHQPPRSSLSTPHYSQGSDHRTPISSYLFAPWRSKQVVTTAEPKECALMLVSFKRKLKPSTSTAAARQEAWSNKWTI